MLADQLQAEGEGAETAAPLFELGNLAISDAAAASMREMLGADFGALYMAEMLEQHADGNWAEVNKKDRAENRFTLSTGEGRVLSTHTVLSIPFLCVTEFDEGDTCTSIILLDEY